MLSKRHHALLFLVVVLLGATLCQGQSTVVSLNVQDSDLQNWSNGTWSVTIYSPPGVPSQVYYIAGGTTPVPNQQQSGNLDASGAATVTLTPNASIVPTGTLWQFTVCPQAYPSPCYTQTATIAGASQTLTLNPPAIRINMTDPKGRVTAYTDIEAVNGNLGSFYFNLTDGLFHVCTTYSGFTCTYTTIAGASGSGTVNTGTVCNVAYYAASSAVVSANSNLCFSGLASNFVAGGSVNILTDGVHAGSVQMVGNTTLPSLNTNSIGLVGPPSAAFTSYTLQFPATAPTNGQFLKFGTPSGSNVPIIYGAGTIFGVDASQGTGTDDCLKLQNTIYTQLPAAGGIINATNLTFAACSVNFFAAPSQSNPTVFTGLPTAGVIYANISTVPADVPIIIPSKWTIIGPSGYGTNRFVIGPSNAALTNRAALSGVGGASGCSSTGGTTVTISNLTISNSNNLLGAYLQCSSNASSTAVPNPTNAQIGGMIIAVTGANPTWTITLGNAGSAGTVTNTGWAINPVIAGWNPASSFGSLITWTTVTCQAPNATYMSGCIGFLDMSSNETESVDKFSVLGADYCSICIFSAQAQNGGPFSNVVLNWGANPASGASTIGIEMGGTGYNASGGGASGLCSTSNPCSGLNNRGVKGITILGCAANTCGVGIDVNSTNVRILDGHCESLQTCVRIGNSAAARGVTVDTWSGCTSAGCAVASVVDLMSTYQSGSSPGPTDDITIRNIARALGTTWNFRDFINLTGDINDANVGTYQVGGSGTAGRMVYTTTQQLSCITTAGAVDTDGSHCAPATQINIASKIGGVWHASGFNNNGTSDICQQILNSFKFAAAQGFTSGATFTAFGFDRNSAQPCGVNMWNGTLGTTIPAGGTLKTGAVKISISVSQTVPANWIWQGGGGNGSAAAGANGTLVSPNINNTVNANFANDTVAGTVAFTLGSTNITGTGTNFTNANIGHYLLACAALPCTNQASMVGGLITGVTSTTLATLDIPAQATISGAAYTITQPLVVNSGIIRDVGFDCNSYGTGGGNGNGGCLGVLQQATAGGDSFIENSSVGHVNAVGFLATGLFNGKSRQLSVSGNGLGATIFTCYQAMQGWSLDAYSCVGGGTAPSLSYGTQMAGQGFTLTGGSFQQTVFGIELATVPTASTNNVTLINNATANGATAVTTLVDLGGNLSGSNGPNAQVSIIGLNCPTGCTNAINDHYDGNVITDSVVGFYFMSKTIPGLGTRTVLTDASTAPATLQVGSFRLLPYNQVFTNKTTAITSTTLATTSVSASLWKADLGLTCLLASAASTVTPTLSWTDTSNTAQSANGPQANCAVLGASSYSSFSLVFNTKASSNIQVSTSIAGTPTYDFRAAAQELTSQ